MNPFLKLIVDAGPLVVFLFTYKYYGMLNATAAILVATIFTIFIIYYYERKIPTSQLMTIIILGVFGGITLYTGDSKYIKIKPTVINALFSIILYIGVLTKHGLLKHIFGNAIEMSEEKWISFSLRWAHFFMFLAFLNEIIWRNFSESLWVNFKVFGMFILTIIFLISQMSFLYKDKMKNNQLNNQLNNGNNANK